MSEELAKEDLMLKTKMKELASVRIPVTVLGHPIVHMEANFELFRKNAIVRSMDENMMTAIEKSVQDNKMSEWWLDQWSRDDTDQPGREVTTTSISYPSRIDLSENLTNYYMWPGWYTIMCTGKDAVENIAILLPDDKKDPVIKPKRWIPLPIGVAYAYVEVQTENVPDGRLILFITGPNIYMKMYPFLAVMFKHGQCLALSRDGISCSCINDKPVTDLVQNRKACGRE
jgi:hypothetical protein